MTKRHIYLIMLLAAAILLPGCNDLPVVGPIPEFYAEYKFDNKSWEDADGREIDVTEKVDEFDLQFRSEGLTTLVVKADDPECSAEILDVLEYDENGLPLTKPAEKQMGRSYYIQRVHVDMRQEKSIVLLLGIHSESESRVPCRVTLKRAAE